MNSTPSSSPTPPVSCLRTGLIRLAALLGAAAVIAGTFGAHWLADFQPADLTPDRAAHLRAVYETGARYHMYHALAIGLLAVVPVSGRAVKVAAILFTVGIVIFAGSLYTLAVTDLRWLGAITPIGGVSFIAGWITLFVATLSKHRTQS